MLRDHEKPAVFSLLVRQVEAQEVKAAADKLIEEQRRISMDAQFVMNNIQTALSVFGFDMKKPKPWEAVREAIGTERYTEALKLGAAKPPLVADSQSETDSDDFELSDELNDEPTPPKVREIVLEQLIAAGSGGIKASSIKEHMVSQGIELHEKTVGMTLYRLSRDGISRREGRIWFFVPEADRKERDEGSAE